MAQFAEGDKVTHGSDPAVVMSVVEVKDNGHVVVSYSVEGKRKLKDYPAEELSKAA